MAIVHRLINDVRLVCKKTDKLEHYLLLLELTQRIILCL